MKRLVGLALAAALCLPLAACKDEVANNHPTDYKTPSTAAPIKEGDKCKKLNTITTNTKDGKKLVCKRTTKSSNLRWRKP